MTSRIKGYCSVCCSIVNCSEVDLQIFKKALQAISIMPGYVSRMNSNSFRITVFKKFQFIFKKFGYCPTTYMIHDAMTALFYLPFLASHSWSKVLRVLMKNERSSLSWILPQSEPMIQESEFNFSKLKSAVCCFYTSLRMNFFISAQLYLTKYWASSFSISYRLVFSVFSSSSRTGTPSSSITIKTYSGFAIFRQTIFITSLKIYW